MLIDSQKWCTVSIMRHKNCFRWLLLVILRGGNCIANPGEQILFLQILTIQHIVTIHWFDFIAMNLIFCVEYNYSSYDRWNLLWPMCIEIEVFFGSHIRLVTKWKQKTCLLSLIWTMALHITHFNNLDIIYDVQN